MHAKSLQRWTHDHVFLGAHHARNERRTRMVVALCCAMMVAEIAGGILFRSMALVADGLHMSTHAAALLIAAIAPMFTSRLGVAQADSDVLQPRAIYHRDPNDFEQAKTISNTIKPCSQTVTPIDQVTTAPAALVTVADVTFEGATQLPIEEQDRIAASIKSSRLRGFSRSRQG